MMDYILKDAAVVRPHGQERILLPAGMSSDEQALVCRHRAAVLETLRSEQMTAAGFYKCLPESLLGELRSASSVLLDLRTTAPTRYVRPFRVTTTTLIGKTAWGTYRVQHPTARLSTVPRARVLTTYTEELGCIAFDLDELSEGERISLFDAVIARKTLAGHDVSRSLSWLFAETSARPRFVLDTMVLFRQIRPVALLRPFRWAAMGEPLASSAETLLQRHSAKSADLSYLSACAQLAPLDTEWDREVSWCVSELSSEHRAYLSDKCERILAVQRFLLDGASGEATQTGIESKVPWYLHYQKALVRLADAHVRGFGFDLTKSTDLLAELRVDVQTGADKLIAQPAFTQLHHLLRNPHTQETAEVEAAFEAMMSTHPEVAISDDQFDGFFDYVNLHRAKFLFKTMKPYSEAARVDGRLHSLCSFATVTSRTTSVQPALQNVLRDPYVRSFFHAKEGHQIVCVDYHAMELYIGSALAQRAISECRRLVAEDDDSWFAKLLRIGAREAGMSMPVRSLGSDENALTLEAAEIRWLGSAVLRRKKQAMATVLESGLDPHLVTALDFARRSGTITFHNHPIKFLRDEDESSRERLRGQLLNERQAGKATNFGLLYGMKATALHRTGVEQYGLSWTAEEANETRNDWFQLYPEFLLWHKWTNHCRSSKQPKSKWKLPQYGESGLRDPRFDVRLYRTSTLSGRPLAALDNLNDALSYQAQGTGADILACALAILPDDVSRMLLLPVHDELVFEVPLASAETVRRTIMDVMTNAATSVLGDAKPIRVKITFGTNWGKCSETVTP